MKPEDSILSAKRGPPNSIEKPGLDAFRTLDGRLFKYNLIFSSIACLFPMAGYAAPQSGQVVSGDASISTPDANTTLIQQISDQSIINWQSFSIGANEYVQFIQPDSLSISLNRVIGGDPSSILGSLSANGQVYLVNPNGIYFGQGVTVDVSGLVASVMDIGNSDFLDGNYVFSRDPAALSASVINEGIINARDNGYVVLMGDYVENSGVIQAQMGQVLLASGSRITLDVSGNNLVSVAVDEAAVTALAGVKNSGEIYADGGRVIMTAKVANDLIGTAVNNEGLVRAGSIVEQDGEIYLTASGGDIVNSGTLDASAQAGSGANGGGVLVYSDRDVTLTPGASIYAQGDGSGDGGRVRVIAQDRLDHQYGAQIDVSSDSGKGGFVEVSGHGSLAIRGDIHAGSGGELLVDPATLTITNSVNAPGFTTGGTSGTAGFVGQGFIAAQLNGNTNVTLVASGSIGAAAGSLGGASFTINASLGSGDLSIVNGNVGIGGTFGACSLTGVCLPGGGTASVTQGATGNINLGTVGININGDLTIAAGSTAGNVSIGFTNIGGNVSITAGTDINLLGRVLGSGSSFVASAGNNIAVNGGIGTSDGTYNANVTLNAGNDVNINSTIRIGAGNLVLAADTDSTLGGDVNILGSSSQARLVRTGGDLFVTGNNFNVQGTVFSFGRNPSDYSVLVEANNIDVTITGDMNISGGVFPVTSSVGTADVSATVSALNNITVNAVSLTVAGGQANSRVDFGGSSNVGAGATLQAVRDVTLTLSGDLNINGGVANAAVVFGAGAANAAADAVVTAGGDLLVNAGNNVTLQAGTATASGNWSTGGLFSSVARADAKLSAVGNLTINAGNGISVSGGNANATPIDGLGTGAATASARAELVAGTAASLNATLGSISMLQGAAATTPVSSPDLTTADAATLISAAELDATAGLDVLLSGVITNTGLAGGAIWSFQAGNNIASSVDFGSSVTLFDEDLTLNAAGSVIINGDIFLGTRNLVLSADTDTALGGDVIINGSVNESRSVTTLGALNVSGANFNLNGADFGSLATTVGTLTALNVDANSVTVNLSNQMNLNAGRVNLADSGTIGSRDVSVTLNATSNIDITAAGLSVNGGAVTANQSSFSAFVNAQGNATLSAGTDININVSGNLSVIGGTANGLASFYSFGSARAFANASIAATGNVNITNVGGAMTLQAGPATAAMTRVVEGSGSVFAQANAEITATNITVTSAGSLNVRRADSIAAITSLSTGVYTATASANASLVATQNVDLTVIGDINLASSGGFTSASASLIGHDTGTYTLNANSNVTIKGDNITINTSNGGLVMGSIDTSAFVTMSPVVLAGSHTVIANAHATTTIAATQNVTINLAGVGNNLSMIGGSASASVGNYACNCTASADASVAITGNTVMVTVANGNLSLIGGTGTSASVDASASAQAFVKTGALIESAQNMTLNVGGNLNVRGGTASANGGNAFNNTTSTVFNSSSATANATIRSGNDLDITVAGNLTIAGGLATATPGLGDTRIANAEAIATVSAVGAAVINVSVGNLSMSQGFVSTSPATLPDILTADASAVLSAATMDVTAGANLSGIGATITTTANAIFNAGVTVSFDAASLVTAGGDLSIIGGSFLVADNANYVSLGGSNLLLDAGAGNLDLGFDIGGSIAPLNADVSMNADGDINIVASVFLGNNILTLAADRDIDSIGDVNVGAVTINTLSTLAISGANLNDLSASINAASLNANASANIMTTNTVVNLTNAATYSAVGDITQSGGSMNVGGNLDMTAGGSLALNGALGLGGSNIALTAGSNLILGAAIGSSVSPLNATVTLLAANDLNITQDIYLGANALTLSADSDSSGLGDVNVGAVTINTLSTLAISGANLNDLSASINAASLNANASANIVTTNTVVNLTNAATYNAVGDITQSGGSMNVGGNLDMTAGGSLALNGTLGLGGSNIALTAGSNLILGAAIGSSISPLNATVTLLAANDLNIAQDIFLGTNSLTLTADSDNSGLGDINISGITTEVSTLSDINLGAQNVNLTNASLAAGTSISMLANADINAISATISASAMHISGGNNIDLQTSNLSIGSGSVAGVTGDSQILNLIGTAGINLPNANPNAKFEAGGNLTMGSVNLSGSNSYLWLVADSVTSGPITAPVSASLLLQYSPFTNSNSIGVESLASMAQQTNYNNTDHFSGTPATTLALGSSMQTGAITIGANGLVDIGSKNIAFVSSQLINSPRNIITTGIVLASGFVAVLEPIAFINPRLESIRVDADNRLTVDDEGDNQLVEDLSEDSGMCTAL